MLDSQEERVEVIKAILSNDSDAAASIVMRVFDRELGHTPDGLRLRNSDTTYIQFELDESADGKTKPLYTSSLTVRIPVELNALLLLESHLSSGFDQLTYGFFGYPLSQAADITFVRAHLVPVGEDQKPHIELTRDIVSKFNQLYGGGKEIIPMPKALIGDVPRLAGLDGDTKMSKSLGNVINLADPPEAVKKTVWKAITDKDKIRKGDPGNPEICNVFKYHKVFNQAERVAGIERDCKTGVLGCVECKGRLTEALDDLLAPIRERRRPYEEHPERVKEILLEGTKKARILGKETLDMVKEAMKIDYF
ncbi:hypothetical protein J7J84_03165 [bacterium]|nr:hypothetical protein [bacterium]